MLWYEKIKEKREALGLTQAELAKTVHISQAAINKIEAGRVLKSRYLPRIANALGLSLSELDPDYSDWRTELKEAQAKLQIEETLSLREFGIFLSTGDAITNKDGDTSLLLTEERKDGSLLIFESPLGKIKRPPYLLQYPSVVAFLLNVEKMTPEFERGDVVFGIISDFVSPETTCIFVSTKYALPEANLARICRVKEVFDHGWNTMQWRSKYNEEGQEFLFKTEWSFNVAIVAKYYASYRPASTPWPSFPAEPRDE